MTTKTNRAWIVGDIAYVDVSTPTFPFAVALVDASDLDAVLDGRGRWHASRPQKSLCVYAGRWVGPRASREYVFLHRYLLDLPRGSDDVGDHRNRDGLDNRRENLRRATRQQNNLNRVSRIGSSRFKGVVRRPSGSWHAQIKIADVIHHLGAFTDEADAARAYDQAARKFHGEFALTNFAEEAA